MGLKKNILVAVKSAIEARQNGCATCSPCGAPVAQSGAAYVML